MEVCCTLGMLNGEQAKQLKEAGLTAYNHNLDTSREFYPSVITTRQVVRALCDRTMGESLPTAAEAFAAERRNLKIVSNWSPQYMAV